MHSVCFGASQYGNGERSFEGEKTCLTRTFDVEELDNLLLLPLREVAGRMTVGLGGGWRQHATARPRVVCVALFGIWSSCGNISSWHRQYDCDWLALTRSPDLREHCLNDRNK